MSEQDSAAISAFIISIIKYLHKMDVIVRNLRPELFVFEEKDSLDIKLLDLSLAMQKKNYKEVIL